MSNNEVFEISDESPLDAFLDGVTYAGMAWHSLVDVLREDGQESVSLADLEAFIIDEITRGIKRKTLAANLGVNYE